MRIWTSFVNLRLSVKILLVLIPVITAMTLMIAVVAYNGVTNLTRQVGNEQIAEEVLVVQAQIVAAEEQLTYDAKYMAQNLAFNQAVLTEDLPAIQTSLLLDEATPSGIDHILVVDADGQPMVKLVDRKIVPVEEASLNELLSFALLGISVSGVIDDDGLMLVAAAPVQTNSGAIVGAVQLGRRLDVDFLRAINFARPGTHLALLSMTGEVLALYIEELHDRQLNVLLDDHQLEENYNPTEELANFGVTLQPDAINRAREGEIIYQHELVYNVADKPLTMAYIPFSIDFEIEGVLVILVDLNTLASFRDNLVVEQIQILVMIGLISAILLVLLSWRLIILPIEQLHQAAVLLSSGDYLHRAEVHSKDEIGRLAMAFNQMASNLLKRDQQISVEISERTRAEKALRESRDDLERRVKKRTHELQLANNQLHIELEQRELAEKKIRVALQEKEVLLKEIHHRVKNNMQVMSSLLRLQSNYADDSATVEVLRESQHRVRSMALVHERLYQSSDLSGIEVSEYVHDLVRHLAESYRSDNHHIALEVQVDELMLDLDTAIPCGLILNELISNAFKHAFNGRAYGKIRIELRGEGKHLSTLVVQDDGTGVPEGLNLQHTKSLGLQLVTSLTRQLNGTIDLLQDNGTTFILRLDSSPCATESR